MNDDMKNCTKVPRLKPIYESREHTDFRELLNFAAFQYKTDDAFIIKTGKDENRKPVYRHVTFHDFKNEVNWFGTGMMKRGFTGKRIALIGKNSYEWYMSYFAVLCGLGIVVPLDKGLPYEETENSLIKSRSDVLLFDKAHLDMVEDLQKNGTTDVSAYYALEDIPGYDTVYDIIDEGRKEMESGNEDFLSLPIDPDAMSILLFTSGTTSKAKAVMLSEHNILANIYMLDRVEDIRHGDVNMAFLPYHHTFGSSGQTMMISQGATTVFCDGLKYIQKNIVEYKVTVFVCVPLLIEAMYRRIQSAIDKQGKRKIYERGLLISRILMKLHIDIRRKLFKDILDQLGGRLRYIVSGASALDPEVTKGFEAIGINVVQGYGMTEASPVIAGENPVNKRPGSIGFSMPDMDLVLADQNEEGIGELVARGSNVMLGYYEDKEATDAILTDGWLHTGDLASLDKDGFIFIRGRKKNVIVLKNGKNVYPEELEDLIDQLPYVVENMVYGQKRHKDGDSKDLTLAARIVYDPDVLKEQYSIRIRKDEADNVTSGMDALTSLVQRDIDKINKTLPSYKQLRRFDLTDEPMEKTTTGKIKRYVQK
ncbi:MAG: AMP-binding protein [Eubacterium sp.]|nr:AMP-binding protein [Eubacterium sp.]